MDRATACLRNEVEAVEAEDSGVDWTRVWVCQGCMAYDDYTLFGVANVSRACARPGDSLGYCTRGFCYVDARTCTALNTQPAEYLWNGRPIPRSSQLHSSYEVPKASPAPAHVGLYCHGPGRMGAKGVANW